MSTHTTTEIDRLLDERAANRAQQAAIESEMYGLRVRMCHLAEEARDLTRRIIAIDLPASDTASRLATRFVAFAREYHREVLRARRVDTPTSRGDADCARYSRDALLRSARILSPKSHSSH